MNNNYGEQLTFTLQKAEGICEVCRDRLAIKTTVIEGRVVNICGRCARGVVPTIRNQVARIGRNQACPCGSGRKFKRCCKEKLYGL